MAVRKTRIGELDALRVVASIAVVAIHVLAAGYTARGDAGNAAPWVFNSYTFIWFATPAFAFLTGALVWNYRPITTLADYASFLRRRASVVLYPYLFWSAFYIIYQRYTPMELRPQLPLGEFIIDIGRLLVLGRASFHLYFLPIVIIFYVVAPLVSAAFRRQPFLTFLGLWGLGAFGTLILPRPTSPHLVSLYRVFELTMWLLPAAAAGGLYGAIRTRYSSVLRRVWPLLLFGGLFMRWYDRGPLHIDIVWIQRATETLYLAVTIIGLACLLELITRNRHRLARTAQTLGVGAFGVYIIHPIGIAVVSDAVDAAGAHSLWQSGPFTIAVTGLVVAVSYGVVLAARQVPALSWVFGMPARRTPQGAQ